MSSRFRRLSVGVVQRVVAGTLELMWVLPPVRRAVSRRARHAWTASDELLVLCSGNIWRSPFAEGVARATRPGRRIHSAGFFPQSGRPSPPEAVVLAEGWGVDLREHRSVVVDRALVEEASAVFVFDASNVLLLALRYPRALRRAHLHGALDPAGRLFVEDPNFRNAAEQRVILDRIATAISEADGVALARPAESLEEWRQDGM